MFQFAQREAYISARSARAEGLSSAVFNRFRVQFPAACGATYSRQPAHTAPLAVRQFTARPRVSGAGPFSTYLSVAYLSPVCVSPAPLIAGAAPP